MVGMAVAVGTIGIDVGVDGWAVGTAVLVAVAGERVGNVAGLGVLVCTTFGGDTDDDGIGERVTAGEGSTTSID